MTQGNDDKIEKNADEYIRRNKHDTNYEFLRKAIRHQSKQIIEQHHDMMLLNVPHHPNNPRTSGDVFY